ncbi:cardiolipin synthase [Capnocytophaga cynodegmi]|uniref:cardiolipin synthase n=1 Tax=Capnocytophaga cynodegmi TaxID=28189 RepID=UPI001AC73C97|nr:cardiolipin synthase [Capnocytophaga cynodegmi]GIM54146.1 major cardiolipin synthase ClsA [Capnocytophaga cynodegmi]
MSFLAFIQIVYIILLIAVCLRIIWDTRSVSKTLAYLLLVIFIPVLGIIFYFSFGINYRRHKIYNKKLEIDQFFRSELETKIEILRKNHLEQPSLSENMEIIRFLSQTEQTFVAPNSSIEILNNGENLFPVLLREMRNAKSHIHIEYYIYENDTVGNQVKEILIEKARQGVEVRFIYDDFGSRSIRKNIVKELEENGVQVFPFHKINFIYFANRINYRNHRKIVVIDGKTSFVGGINVSDKYINSAENELYWRDTHLMIKGVTSLSLQMVFLSDWNFCSNENITIQPTYFPTDFSNLPKDYYAQIAYSGPDSDLPTILYTTIQAIYSAKEEILLTTPYYIPDTSLQEALIIASLSGISVKLLLPKESDSFLVNITSQSFLEELLRAGVKIYLYKKGFVHSKTFVIDGKWASVGTANLDARSFDLNFEVSALIYNQDIALQLRETFHKDLLDSEILTLEKWEKRPKYKQLAEKILRLTSPFM